MKSTSIILFILGAVTTLCLKTLDIFFQGFFEPIRWFFTGTCIVFFIIGIFNIMIMVNKKANKKYLYIHLVPLLLIVAMFWHLFLLMGADAEWGYLIGFYMPYTLIYLIPHILSFGALWTHMEYITKNQAKDKHIADLEAEIAQLKNS
jgi:hypothetical protein